LANLHRVIAWAAQRGVEASSIATDDGGFRLIIMYSVSQPFCSWCHAQYAGIRPPNQLAKRC
jgi:hypothetical protein